MNFPLKKLSIKGILLLTLTLPFLQSCAHAQSSAAMTALDDKPFNDWTNSLMKQIKADPQYKRLPLDNSYQTDEFIVLLHDAYRKKISKNEFSKQISTQYPGHQYEATFIVSRLP